MNAFIYQLQVRLALNTLNILFRKVLNDLVKFDLVLSGLVNRFLCFEQNDRFQVNAVFGCHFLLVLVENKRLYNSVFFFKICLDDIDIFGIAVIAKLS